MARFSESPGWSNGSKSNAPHERARVSQRAYRSRRYPCGPICRPLVSRWAFFCALKGNPMQENLQEYVNSAGVAMRVDREHSVLRGVKLLGIESRNGRRYLPTALAQAAALYENAKVNVNHPKGHPTAARD